MDTNQGNRPGSGQMRIVQELVAGKALEPAEISLICIRNTHRWYQRV